MPSFKYRHVYETEKGLVFGPTKYSLRSTEVHNKLCRVRPSGPFEGRKAQTNRKAEADESNAGYTQWFGVLNPEPHVWWQTGTGRNVTDPIRPLPPQHSPSVN